MGLNVIREDSVRSLRLKSLGIDPPKDWGDVEQVRAVKRQEIGVVCTATISTGIDVELSTGTEHFSLQTHDQTNIDSMFTAVTLGAKQYPYHSDGNQCVMYSAADIVALYVAYKSFVTQQTTYCNFLNIWLKRETDAEAAAAIQYGSELPADLAGEMTAILGQAAAQIQTIIEKMKQ